LKLWFILIQFFNPCHLDSFKDFFTTVGRIIIERIQRQHPISQLDKIHGKGIHIRQGFAILHQGHVDVFKEAIAKPEPQILNLASSMMPRSFTWICKRITSPQAGAPNIPVPTLLDLSSSLPTLPGFS
jgi:hypothetical protein|tara:strand:- start:119727 stop:120110 length:384 start_codon:yes stop_codon:yes gene_type:complete